MRPAALARELREIAGDVEASLARGAALGARLRARATGLDAAPPDVEAIGWLAQHGDAGAAAVLRATQGAR